MPLAQITARQYAPTAGDYGTVLGPLTTVFYPPDHCFTVPPNGYAAQTCSTDGTAYWDPSCFPPATTTPFPTNADAGADGYYSPGLICPTGYTTACANTGSDPFSFAYPTRPGETVVGCCQSGFACYPGAALCSSSIVTPMPFSYPFNSCSGGSSQTPTTTYDLDYVVGPLIQMNWQSTDLASLSSSSSFSPSSAPPSTILTGIAPTSGPTQTPVQKSSSHAGAIAGGVVGGVAGLALLVLIPFFFLRYRRRKAQAGGDSGGAAPPGASEWVKPELDGNAAPTRQELEEAGERHELMGNNGKKNTADPKTVPPPQIPSEPVELQG